MRKASPRTRPPAKRRPIRRWRSPSNWFRSSVNSSPSGVQAEAASSTGTHSITLQRPGARRARLCHGRWGSTSFYFRGNGVDGSARTVERWSICFSARRRGIPSAGWLLRAEARGAGGPIGERKGASTVRGGGVGPGLLAPHGTTAEDVGAGVGGGARYQARVAGRTQRDQALTLLPSPATSKIPPPAVTSDRRRRGEPPAGAEVPGPGSRVEGHHG